MKQNIKRGGRPRKEGWIREKGTFQSNEVNKSH